MSQEGSADRRIPPADWTPTVLIVDDESDILITLETTLESNFDDIRVLTARSGPEALALLENETVDLILTDYRMPAMDGLRFLDSARPLAPHAGRMVITAYPDLELAVRALNEAAIVNFITKPMDKGQVLDVVGGYLEDRRKGLDQKKQIAKAFERLRTMHRR